MTMDMIIPTQISVEKKDMIMSSVMIIVAMITASIILFVMRRSRINNHNDSDV